jgi:putative oxidoreductase
MSIMTIAHSGATNALRAINPLQDVFLLGIRLWLANVFFLSGLTKIKSWDTTLMLFEYEYSVPIIPFELAAYMSTAAELAIPVFLVFGLLTRLNAIALFVLNIVAAISYADISPAGEKDHIIWGLMTGMLFLYGPGRVAADWLIERKWLSPKSN